MGEAERKFEITVEGQYYGAHDTTGAPTIKAYKAVFVLPSPEAALSVICKHLLDPYLRKHYPDYAKFRSHKITSMISNGRLPDAKVLQMSFDDMDVRDLFDFCILKHIFVDPYKHKDLEKCRTLVKDIWEKRVAQQKADQKSGVAKEKAEVEDLLALNKLEDTSNEINVNEQKIGAALKKGDSRIIEPATDDVDAGAPLPPTEDDILG
jgi:hypothetical protein